MRLEAWIKKLGFRRDANATTSERRSNAQSCKEITGGGLWSIGTQCRNSIFRNPRQVQLSIGLDVNQALLGARRCSSNAIATAVLVCSQSAVAMVMVALLDRQSLICRTQSTGDTCSHSPFGQ